MTVRIFSFLISIGFVFTGFSALANPAVAKFFSQDKQTIQSALNNYREQTTAPGRAGVIQSLTNIITLVIDGDETERNLQQRLELRMFESLLFPTIDAIVRENVPCADAILNMQSRTGEKTELERMATESYSYALQFVNHLCQNQR